MSAGSVSLARAGRAAGPARLGMTVVCLALAGSLLPSAGAAQLLGDDRLADFDAGMRTGIGWNLVLPDALAGVGAFHFIGESPWGLLASWRFTHDSLEDERFFCGAPTFSEECSVGFVERNFFQDLDVADRDEWSLFSLSLLRQLTPEFALMLGGGLAEKTVIREYQEQGALERFEDQRYAGYYFVPNEEDSGRRFSLGAGAIFRAGSGLVFQAGYESAPGSMALGIFWAFR